MSRCGKARVIENGFSCATVPIVLQNGRMKRALLLGVAMVAAIATSQIRTATQTVSTFAALSEQLSEPNGDFDTDNLISNESSYLHVIPALEQGGVTGGVYIGVGPDQNFSYIARIRPASAFIIDIRRDNLLLDLLLETDRRGRQLCFLSSEDDFQFVKNLQARDLIVPVVGNLAGPKALAAIGQEVGRRGDKVSAFYISNIENYLFRDGSFQRYIENVKKLPHTDKSVVIRSLFGGYQLPESVPGYYSASAIQTFNELLANCGSTRCRGYFDLLKR